MIALIVRNSSLCRQLPSVFTFSITSFENIPQNKDYRFNTSDKICWFKNLNTWHTFSNLGPKIAVEIFLNIKLYYEGFHLWPIGEQTHRWRHHRVAHSATPSLSLHVAQEIDIALRYASVTANGYCNISFYKKKNISKAWCNCFFLRRAGPDLNECKVRSMIWAWGIEAEESNW